VKILFIANWNSRHHRRWVNFFSSRGHECTLLTRFPVSGVDLPVFLVDPFDSQKGREKLLLAERLNDCMEKFRFLPESVRRVVYHHVVKRMIHGVIHEYKPDLVVVINAWPDALYVRKSTGVKTALLSMGSDILCINSIYDRHRLARRLREFDLLVAPSPQMIDRMIEWAVIPENTYLCRYGINLEEVGEYRDVNNINSKRVIYSRGFRPVYNAETALLGVRSAMDNLPEINLLLTSPYADDNAAIKHMVDKLKFGDRIRTTGEIGIDEVYSLLAGSRVYLSSSFSDGASTALIEAMWLGCFPVVSDIPANREWVKNGENGLLFSPDSPRELSLCLERAFKDDELFERARKHNREVIIRQGDLLRNLEKLESRFQQLV